jgi:microcystin degradation protein MlrC
VVDASLIIGCAWTDSPYTSTAALVVGWSRDDAEREAAALALAMWDRRAEFGPEAETASVGEAVERALGARESTVFISDSGDNVTAGGAGDSPVFLERLVAAGARSAVVAGIADAGAVEACRLAGVGAVAEVALGGKLDATNFRPLLVRGSVERLGERFAVLRVEGVEVVLTADRRGFTTLADFSRVGIDPLARKVAVVKLGYLFPELRECAPRAILALSPGFTDLQLDRLPYRRLARPIYPLDGEFAWSPEIA